MVGGREVRTQVVNRRTASTKNEKVETEIQIFVLGSEKADPA